MSKNQHNKKTKITGTNINTNRKESKGKLEIRKFSKKKNDVTGCIGGKKKQAMYTNHCSSIKLNERIRRF
jgi:hypothetical protein